MKDKFTLDLNSLADQVRPQRTYRLADVKDRIERVAYDLVRFRDNDDTDQLWKIENGDDGPVIIALYGDDGSLITSESSSKGDWDTVPDKKAMHIYYKGEPLVSLSESDMGIPADEFNIARRWMPKKLASDETLQAALFSKVADSSRRLIVQRFPELTKVAAPTGNLNDEGANPLDTKEEFNWEDEETEMREFDDPPSWSEETEPDRSYEGFEGGDEEVVEPHVVGPDEPAGDSDTKDTIEMLIDLREDGDIDRSQLVGAILKMINKAASSSVAVKTNRK